MFGIVQSLDVVVCQDAQDAQQQGHIYHDGFNPVTIERVVVVRNGTEACHEHINDAISEHQITEAGNWRVVPLFECPDPKQAERIDELETELEGWKQAARHQHQEATSAQESEDLHTTYLYGQSAGLETMRKQADRIAELERENATLRKDAERYRWIPVDEKLPNPEVSVFVAREGRQFAEKACHTGKEWLLESNHNPVTHWALLPMTPEVTACFEREMSGAKKAAMQKENKK